MREAPDPVLTGELRNNKRKKLQKQKSCERKELQNQ